MIHNITVCSHDCNLARNTFHPWWIKGAVKSIWSWDGPLLRMVWQQQSELHFRVKTLCFFDCRYCKAVKSTIVTDDDFCDAIFQNVLLNSCIQWRVNLFWCLSVSDKETAFSAQISPSFVVAFIVKIIRYKWLNHNDLSKYNLRRIQAKEWCRWRIFSRL